MWKKMGEGEEDKVSKIGLITLLNIEWKEPDHDVSVEFFNTFVIKGSEIYYGKKGIVYVIGKQITVDEFKVYHNGYVEDPKG
jgi:hypothetical protein